MTSSDDNMYYWRGLHEWHLSGVSTPCSKDILRRNLKDESFRPNSEKGNAISMCIANAISEEEFLSHLQSIQEETAKKPKTYKAIAVLSAEELKASGFTFDRNDTPFTGHVDTINDGYPTMSKEKRQLLRDKLKKLAIDRGVRFFGYKDGRFYEIKSND